ncbi:MAG TPA: hypothetical protein VHY30_01580 [Verrucomicrobiae bacterium]|nr:hypothetical protein [Verrucomicrobiae bacterium]
MKKTILLSAFAALALLLTACTALAQWLTNAPGQNTNYNPGSYLTNAPGGNTNYNPGTYLTNAPGLWHQFNTNVTAYFVTNNGASGESQNYTNGIYYFNTSLSTNSAVVFTNKTGSATSYLVLNDPNFTEADAENNSSGLLFGQTVWDMGFFYPDVSYENAFTTNTTVRGPWFSSDRTQLSNTVSIFSAVVTTNYATP